MTYGEETQVTWKYFVLLGAYMPTSDADATVIETAGEIVSLPTSTEALERALAALGRPYESIEGTEDRFPVPAGTIVTGYTIERYDGEETDPTWSLNGGLKF